MKGLIAAAALAATVFAGAQAAHAQEAVVGVVHAESMFTSPDPKLNRNKQAAYHIMKDLLEAGHWDEAGKWLTKEYHQHNPLAASGLDGVVYYFTQVAKVKPKPVPEKLGTPIVAVLAEGDYVTVVTPRVMKDPKDPSKTYTTTWFDMWRFKDGKADEHWDPAVKPPAQ
jgi:predicted SnoaL-like aldol condensation-catalyzing enzyme